MFELLHMSMRLSKSPKSGAKQLGFTLIELVVVIAVMAIIGGMSVSFVRLPVQSYVNTETNIALADEADTALRRMTRDIRNALPNSVRVTSVNVSPGVDSYYIEFVPIIAAGRYRSENDSTGTRNVLDFNSLDTSFDVLGAPVSVEQNQQLVIYNMALDGADVYQGLNRRTFPSQQLNVNQLSFTATANPIPFASPSSRFYVVNNAVSYVCNLQTRQLERYEYALPATQASIPAQPTTFAGTARVLASNVDSCLIEYSAGVLERSGVVTLALTLSKIANNPTSPKARLVGLVNVLNSP